MVGEITRDKSLTAPELWSTCVDLLWDGVYVDALDQLLCDHRVTTLLDCGGGTGFPSIDLAERGWDVSYADKSPEMLGAFAARCADRGVHIPAYLADWVELSKIVRARYDALLCRGNSLVYAGSWGTPALAPDSRRRIRRAIEQFYRLLNPGGVLYVDVIRSDEYDRAEYPVRHRFERTLPDASRVTVVWEVSHDYSSRTRAWRTVVQRGDERYDQTYWSYLLRHQELLADLRSAGFRHIEPMRLAGDETYDAFLARR